MTTKDYQKKIEQELIKTFSEDFYKKIGYYPTVITKSQFEEKHLNLLSLEELQTYFDSYLPTLKDKKLKLSSKTRIRELVELRQMFCFMARCMGYSLSKIGRFLGKRDHTTVIHNIRTFHNLIDTDQGYKERFNLIKRKIKDDGNYFNTSIMVGSYKTQYKP